MNINAKPYFLMLSMVVLILAGCRSTPPELTLTGASRSLAASQGSYCWDGLCADIAYPSAIEAFAEIPADGSITLDFARPNPDSLFMGLLPHDGFPAGDYLVSLKLESVSDPIAWTPGLPAGDYVLVVSASWAGRGDASYYIGVTVP